MFSKRKLLHDGGVTLNLDSLVDIVSNSVGILIILAVFMALISFMEFTPQTTPDTRVNEETNKILIPWGHYSQKTAMLFLIRENRVLRLDRGEYYQKLKNQLHGPDPSIPQRLTFDTHSVEIQMLGGNSHCLYFEAKPGAGLWWHQLSGGNRPLENLTSSLPPEEYYFFFWVDSDSFELFRDLRESLWERDFEVGWKPVEPATPLQYCSGYSQSRSFRPQ